MDVRSRLRSRRGPRAQGPAGPSPRTSFEQGDFVSWMPTGADTGSDTPALVPAPVAEAPVARADAWLAAARAYCVGLLPAPLDEEAALEAVAAWERASALTSGQAAAEEEMLLGATRLMAAVTLPDRSTPEERRQAVWASIGGEARCTCREAPALLAARRNGTLPPGEAQALDAHLAGCAGCAELQRELTAAEERFRAAFREER